MTGQNRDRSRSKSKKRHDAMYTKTDLFERQQIRDERKREETKKELKSLLTRFIGPDRARHAVENAQHKMGVMHERH